MDITHHYLYTKVIYDFLYAEVSAYLYKGEGNSHRSSRQVNRWYVLTNHGGFITVINMQEYDEYSLK